MPACLRVVSEEFVTELAKPVGVIGKFWVKLGAPIKLERSIGAFHRKGPG